MSQLCCLALALLFLVLALASRGGWMFRRNVSESGHAGDFCVWIRWAQVFVSGFNLFLWFWFFVIGFPLALALSFSFLRICYHPAFPLDWCVFPFRFRRLDFSLLSGIGVHRRRILVYQFCFTLLFIIVTARYLFVLLPVQTADLQMDLIVLLDRVRKFFGESALGQESQVCLVVVFMTVEDVLKVYCFIWYI